MSMTREDLMSAILPIAEAAAESRDDNLERAASILYSLLGSLTAGTLEMEELSGAVYEVTKVQAVRAETIVHALQR